MMLHSLCVNVHTASIIQLLKCVTSMEKTSQKSSEHESTWTWLDHFVTESAS